MFWDHYPVHQSLMLQTRLLFLYKLRCVLFYATSARHFSLWGGALRTRADRRRREEGDRPDQREATRVPWLVAGYRGGREGGWVRGGLRLSGEKVNKSPLEFLIIVRLLGGETPNCFIAQARKSDQAKPNFYCLTSQPCSSHLL